MTRYDLRWLRRHPLRWVRVMWLPWTVAVLLVVKAFVVTEPVFSIATAAPAWPIILGAAAGIVAASAIAPLEPRLQALAASVLFGVAVLRVLTYADTFVRAGDALSSDGRVVVVALGVHWLIVAAIATVWPVLLDHAGRLMAVEAGRDDRGVG